jgi:hypothetical protein
LDRRQTLQRKISLKEVSAACQERPDHWGYANLGRLRAILTSHFLRLEDSMISLKPESPEELRKRLREMSNLELRRFGERARKLSDLE